MPGERRQERIDQAAWHQHQAVDPLTHQCIEDEVGALPGWLQIANGTAPVRSVLAWAPYAARASPVAPGLVRIKARLPQAVCS
jgi:hypothetical protein